MDLTVFNELLLNNQFMDISDDLKKFQNQTSSFYYDETNNIRKFWLDKQDFNAPIDKDFILGGVMHFGDAPPIDFDSIKIVLRLQKSVKEIKFRYISKSADFLDCLKEPKVRIFLGWLHQSELYVHYSNINNLYYAIVDIIDDINMKAETIEFIDLMKNELYKLACKNYPEFYKLLLTYNYPNIDLQSIAPFYQEIINFIDRPITELSMELLFLRKILVSAKSQNEMVFLQNNPENTIIEDYHLFYLRPLGLFPTSQHIFDHEYLVEELFSQYDSLLYNNSIFNNYSFVDSKENLLIQISDCVVGLIGKHLNFINNLNHKNIIQLIDSLDSVQRKNLKLFAQLLEKSENISKLLIHSSTSLEHREAEAAILQFALILD